MLTSVSKLRRAARVAYRIGDAGDIRRPLGLLSLIGLTVLVMGSSPVTALTVRVERIDGTKLSGDWVGATPSEVRISVGGSIDTFPVDEVARIEFRSASPKTVAEKPRRGSGVPAEEGGAAAEFFLRDGGYLSGYILAPSPAETVLTRTPLGDRQSIPFDRLAGVRLGDPARFVRAEVLFQGALADRPPGHDAIITRDADEPKLLRGLLESISAEGGTFRFSERVRAFRNDKTYGLILAAGALADRPSRFPVTLLLADGGRVTGVLQRADETELSLETSLGFSSRVALTQVHRLELRSDRVVFVDDLAPDRQILEGLLHRPWPVERDRNLFGGPLAIAGQRFDRGLCLHSRAELTFAINGEYEKLAATVGIDDSVRPMGSVLFRVIGDGKVLWESGPVTGLDVPQEVVVPLGGVSELTLLVDYGDALDIGDHAVWGDLRLIKTRPTPTGPS